MVGENRISKNIRSEHVSPLIVPGRPVINCQENRKIWYIFMFFRVRIVSLGTSIGNVRSFFIGSEHISPLTVAGCPVINIHRNQSDCMSMFGFLRQGPHFWVSQSMTGARVYIGAGTRSKKARFLDGSLFFSKSSMSRTKRSSM